MSRINKTQGRLMEIWNDLDKAYEYMERSLEKLSSMSNLSGELEQEINNFDISAISSIKQHVEMLLGNEAFKVWKDDYMNNGNKFKSLIVDTYNKAKEGNLVGIVYSAVSTYGFRDLKDINGFAENINSDMLYLKSKLTDIEVDIYKWELEDYKIKSNESTIYVKLSNKPEIALMY